MLVYTGRFNLVRYSYSFINGQLLLQNIRKESNVPIIMVTSSNSEVDEVLSMSYGADDYITKPYNPTILLLRINAIFKRLHQVSDTPDIQGYADTHSKGIIEKRKETNFINQK